VHGQNEIIPYEAFQAHVGNLRQLSSGFVKLRDRNPFSHPIIQPNLCENE
jgi:choline dehydrogenase